MKKENLIFITLIAVAWFVVPMLFNSQIASAIIFAVIALSWFVWGYRNKNYASNTFLSFFAGLGFFIALMCFLVALFTMHLMLALVAGGVAFGLNKLDKKFSERALP